MSRKKPNHEGSCVDLGVEAERLLELERDLQAVRLELEETQRLYNAARHELNLTTSQSQANLKLETEGQIEKLFQALSGPAAQIMAQDHMLNMQGKSLQARDIQLSANRILRVLQKHGLTVQNAVGEVVRFDQDLHEPLTIEPVIQAGDEVVVRMSGISYQGKILRRAAVSRDSNDTGGER